jgi:alpha-glucosidase
MRVVGLGPEKDLPPTDWQCFFGGSAWSPSGQNDGQWYFHMFCPAQPDFNWDNEEVKQDFIKTLRFWGDRGVNGFRIDVAHNLTKDMTEPLIDWEEATRITKLKLENGNGAVPHPFFDRDETHEIFKTWRRVMKEYDPPLM